MAAAQTIEPFGFRQAGDDGYGVGAVKVVGFAELSEIPSQVSLTEMKICRRG
jgi:hypothetical protein